MIGYKSPCSWNQNAMNFLERPLQKLLLNIYSLKSFQIQIKEAIIESGFWKYMQSTDKTTSALNGSNYYILEYFETTE